MSVNVFIQNEKLCLLIIRRLYNKMGLKSCSLKSLSCAVRTIKMFLHGEIETLCLCFEVIIADVEKKGYKDHNIILVSEYTDGLFLLLYQQQLGLETADR